jgi:hypothetical protein
MNKPSLMRLLLRDSDYPSKSRLAHWYLRVRDSHADGSSNQKKGESRPSKQKPPSHP